MRRALTWISLLFLAGACAGGGATEDTDGGFAGGDGSGGSDGGDGRDGRGGRGGADGNGGNDGNRRPVLERIGDREVAVGSLLEIALTATDPDGDPLFFNARSSLPEGAKFNKEGGQFTWTPAAGQEGTIVLITFEVSDSQLRDQETIQITVVAEGQGGNRPPLFDEIGDQILIAGRPFAMKVVATDPNGDEITYSLRGDAIEGASLDAKTGDFTWTPDVALAGQSFSVTFVATDAPGAEATADAKLVVRDEGAANQNLPPRIEPLDDVEATVGQEVQIVVRAEDDHPETLEFGTVGPLPAGSQFDANAATFRWTPRPEHADQAFRVVFQVSDGEFRAVERVTVQVRAGEGPTPPECPAEPAEPVALAPDSPAAGGLCPAGDEDAFAFQIPAAQTFTVRMAFQHARGDLDLEVTGPGNFRRISDGITDEELVRVVSAEPGEYLAQVYAFLDVTNPAYTITLTLEAAPPVGCQDDAAEGPGGNDDAATAANLRDFLDQDLQVCADNRDFYHVDLTAGGRVVVRALFAHADGDIDMRITGPDNFRRPAVSSTDNEEIVLDPVPATGRYVLELFGFQGAENDYRLQIEEAAPPQCDPDRVEPNDTPNAAEPLRPELYRNLTWCGEPDWYKTELQAGEEVQVYISHDGPAGTTMTLHAANGDRLPEQSYEVANGDGCQAGRAQCRRLRGRLAAGGWIYYTVTAGQVGMSYDLNVRVRPAAVGPQCVAGSVSCDELSLCDRASGQCVEAFCDANGQGCPGQTHCVQEWCVEACGAGGSCTRADFECKRLDGADRCGYSGRTRASGSCFDFSDCQGSLGCARGGEWVGGFCTRDCDANAQCGEQAVCADYFETFLCMGTCLGDNECRDNYLCLDTQDPAGSPVRVCMPAWVK